MTESRRERRRTSEEGTRDGQPAGTITMGGSFVGEGEEGEEGEAEMTGEDVADGVGWTVLDGAVEERGRGEKIKAHAECYIVQLCT